MNGKNLKQILSTTLSLTLAVSSAPIPAGAIGPMEASAPAFVTRLTPPEQFGYVASSFASKGEEKPRLIIMSDLHAHVEVQHNIMNLLMSLVPKLRGQSDKKVPIFLEGGWEDNLEEPLKGMSNPQIRTFFDEYYLQKAEMGGPQAYSEHIAGSNQVTMVGVEDKEEYLANKARFAKTYPQRRQLLEAIKLQETAMRLLSDEVEGSSFKNIQKMRDDYNAGQLHADRYAKVLLRYADRYHMESRYVSVLRQVSTANQNDLDRAFANVYRDVSVRLSEKKPLTAFLRQQLGNEGNIRANLARVDGDIDLLKRLISNQLTPSEVTLAMSRIGALINVANLLLQGQILTVNIGDVIRESLDFYPLAFVRDETLVKNSLAWLDKMGPDSTGILVAGGFHTDAIAAYLLARNIPYIVINPNITRDLTTEEQLNYVKRMNGDHVSAKEVETDLAWIENGRQQTINALSTGMPITSTKENVIQPNDKGTGSNEEFLGGLNPDVRKRLAEGGNADAAALAAIGLDVTREEATVAAPEANTTSKEIAERIAAVQRHIDAMAGQNGMNRFKVSAAMPGKTLVLDSKSGRYVEEGRDVNAPPTALEQTVNASIAARAPGLNLPERIFVQAIGTRQALVELGAESRLLDIGENVAVIPIALDRFNQLQAIDEEPAAAPGSANEHHRQMAVHTIAHEATHIALPGASEAAVTSHGLAVGAIVSQSRFGEDGAQRFAMAIPAQMAFGNVPAKTVSSKTLAEGIAGILAPKSLQNDTVSNLAKKFAAEQLMTSDPAELQAELTKLQGTMEYRLALFGYSAPLLKKLREQLAQKYAVATAA